MIKVNEQCCGCGACVQKCPQRCISMKETADGFDYPDVDAARCISCGLCEDVCPLNMLKSAECADESVYIGYSNREEERKRSSSGGVFSLLAEKVLQRDGLVFGAAFDDSFEVCHIGITNPEQLDALRRSKYVQSRIGETYQEAQNALEAGRMVLFSGTPCQIAGLKSFLGRDYPTLYTIDLICHGAPSPRVWKKYKEELRAHYASPIRAISFRNKDTGWKEFSVCFEFENGEKYASQLWSDPYMRIFLENICLRHSCYNCTFKGQRYYSDLTLGDAWGIGKKYPLKDDDKGTSAVVAHTSQGRTLLTLIEGQWNGEVLTYDFAAENIAYLKPVAEHPRKKEFIRKLNSAAGVEELAALTKLRLIDKVIRKIKRAKQKILP